MPIRIYALAKELKVDSKELVDTCAKAGVTGKGSALASLDDAELEKVKAYIAGADKKSAATSAPPVNKGAPVRPAPSPVIGKKVAPAKAAPEKAAPVKAAPVKPEKKEYTREDYIAPVARAR